MTPRPYQQLCLEAVDKGFEQFSKQALIVPTGGGKTLIFSWLAKNRLPGRTLILAHREELIDQAIDKLHKATGIRADKEKAESWASLEAPVVVASYQSLVGDRLRRWPQDHFSLVVGDEAHHAIAPSQQVVLNHFDPFADVLGVTATYDRGDKKNLGVYFENIAAEVPLYTRRDNPIPGLVDSGYLAPIAIQAMPLKIDLSKVKCEGGDFAPADLGNAIDPYLGQIVEEIRKHASNRRILAFLPLIATSRKFVEICNAAGVRAAHVDGESPDRREILDRFAGGEFDLLSNAMLLTEGYDVDAGPTGIGIDCLLWLRPTRSRALYAQGIGRGTRTALLKENLLILDPLWMHERHKIARPAHLIAETEEEAEAITRLTEADRPGMPADLAAQLPLDLEALAGQATHQREESLRKQLEAQSKKRGKFISAEQFAIDHDSLATAEYEPAMKWEREPVTPAQLRVLRKAHIDPESVSGKGHASRLISLYFATKPIDLASPAQRSLMRRMGHENPDDATAADARKFFADLRQQKREPALI